MNLRPMLVTSAPLRPDSDKYSYEVKWDGLNRRSTVLAWDPSSSDSRCSRRQEKKVKNWIGKLRALSVGGTLRTGA